MIEQCAEIKKSERISRLFFITHVFAAEHQYCVSYEQLIDCDEKGVHVMITLLCTPYLTKAFGSHLLLSTIIFILSSYVDE